MHTNGHTFATSICLAVCVALATTNIASAQAQDSTGIKRAFLDRYLDCAEAPNAAARLECYDALLVDIPTWLEDPEDPPSGAIQTGAETEPLEASEGPEPTDH
jgi:hypothetical protein